MARKRPGKPSRSKAMKPFLASKHPHRDFRGEKIVRGKKYRT